MPRPLFITSLIVSIIGVIVCGYLSAAKIYAIGLETLQFLQSLDSEETQVESAPQAEEVYIEEISETNSPSDTVRASTSARATSSPAITRVEEDTCNGVFYDGKCSTQTCIDLDAPNLSGYDGDQYATASNIIWIEKTSQTQYRNADYCDANGNLVEYFCSAKAGSFEPEAFVITDSTCENGKSVNN